MTDASRDRDLPLILLAGMGADGRLFAPQAEAFANLVLPRWIEPESKESLASYAKRLAAAVDPGGPCLVGGASFGGFVAVEVARHLDARACLLIGSARSPDELPARVRMLRALMPAIGALPFGLLTTVVGAGVTTCGSLSSPSTRGVAQQLADADARFLRWAARAVLTWRPVGPCPCPVLQIHGGRDAVLPARGRKSSSPTPATCSR